MKCTLVAISKPRIEGLDTAEELIAFCARVSNPANQNNTTTAGRLLQYLAENKHWSPFEQVSLTIEVETTRDIARQLLRHRSFVFQEFSQRYAKVLEFAEPREARLQDKKNRQNSLEVEDVDLETWWAAAQKELIFHATRVYTTAIDRGIAKEQARAVLPEGLTMSRLYVTGNLRNWIHYCQVRCDPSTQKEHREIANDCKRIILEEFPNIAFLFNGE